MSPRRILSLFGEAATRYGQDRAPRLAAALAFYTVVSLAPLLLVLVGIAGQLYGEEAVRGELVARIQDAVGREAAVLVENALRNAALEAEGWSMALIGVIGLLVAASTLFVHLKMALNDIWGIARKPSGGLLHEVRHFLFMRVLAVLALMGIGLLLMLMLLSSAVIETMAIRFHEVLPMPPLLLRLGTVLLSLGLVTVLFAYVYRALPDVRIRWRTVWLGAFVTAILFTIGKELLAIYLGRSAVGSAYGAAGALVVLLVWVYYSAAIFFFGAELTQVYAGRRGAAWRARRGFLVSEQELAPPPEQEPESGNTGR